MSPNQPSSDNEQSRARIGRPPRLDTATVIGAAIELADKNGLDELSMPKLARRLGVGTMTVYSYVDNKQDLLDQMAARMFAEIAIADVEDWQTQLQAFFSDFRQAALAHPTLAGLLASGRVTIPAVFDILEIILTKMTDDGIPVEDAVRTFYAALSYTIGYVLWEIPRAHLQDEGAYENQWADLISQLDPVTYPILTGPAAAITRTVASTRQFTWGLKKVLGT